MKRTIIGITTALALVTPATGMAAKQGKAPSPNATCKAERAAIGVTAFRDLYGTNRTKANAFGKCVSTAAKRDRKAKTAANATCKTEQAADAAAFTAKYGTGRKGKNAFGKCVSQRAKATRKAQEQERVNAAKTCKAERKADAAAFTAKYGTGRKGRNAFGRCVSQTEKAGADA